MNRPKRAHRDAPLQILSNPRRDRRGRRLRRPLTFPSRGRWIFAAGEKTDEVVAERFARDDVGIVPYNSYPTHGYTVGRGSRCGSVHSRF